MEIKVKKLLRVLLLGILYWYLPIIFLNFGTKDSIMFNTVNYWLSRLIVSATCFYLLIKSGDVYLFKKRKFQLKDVCLWIILLLLLFVVTVLVSLNFSSSQNGLAIQENRELISSLNVPILFLGLARTFGIFVIVFSEEIFFRGVLMTHLFPNSRYYFDVMVSAILFSLSHLSVGTFVLTDMLYYLPSGLVLGFLVKKYKSIYPAFIIHYVWNSFGMILALLV